MIDKIGRITIALLVFAICFAHTTPLPADLLDDFSDPYISGEKWMNREFVREVSDGQLIIKLGINDEWNNVRNTVSMSGSESINAVRATISLYDLVLDSGDNPQSFIQLGGHFYNYQPSGSPGGDVSARIVIGNRGSGLEVYWVVMQDPDGNSNWQTIGTGSLIGPIADPDLPVAYTVGIDFDGNNQFTFSVGSISQTFTGPAYSRPVIARYQYLQAGINTYDGSKIGYVSAAVDDVYINNQATAYDTFDGPALDASKWNEREFAREVDAGEARLNVQTNGVRQDGIFRPRNQASGFLQATALVESDSVVTNGAVGIARIGGYYYNESHGPGTVTPYDGNTGDVWLDNRLVLDDAGQLSAECMVYRMDTPDPWGPGTELFKQVFNTPIGFDTAYTLAIDYTGTQVIFTLDDETHTYDILTDTYLPSEGRKRQLLTRVYADSGQSGYMKARFDDVHVSPDAYMIYATFDPPNIDNVISVGGYVEDYGVPTTWGDEIQYVYFLSGNIGYKVRTWLTDSTDPTDPTTYIEPRQHPDHPRFPGPIEPRHFDIISSKDLADEAPSIGWSSAHKKEFHVDSTGIYVGAYLSGIHQFDHDWNYIGQIAPQTPVETESLAYDPVAATWYAGGRQRTIYMLEDTNLDADYMDETWQPIFTYPTYMGGHHDGLEFAAGYLWVSDMTSDMIGQWQVHPDTGLWTEFNIYTYTSPAHVEGMGFGPNNHFWIGSGWGSEAYFYELGNDITARYPVAVAGEDVPAHPPLIPIVFDGSGSYHQNPNRRIVSYEWDFEGIGEYKIHSLDPIDSYGYPIYYLPDGETIDWEATARDYAAVLRVTDDTPEEDGGPLTATDVRIVHITAPPWKPVADPNGPYNTRVGDGVDLDGTASYDPESLMYEPDHPWYETLASYEWDMDNDGEFDDASGEIVQWQWDTEGTYFVCLRVTDSVPNGPGGTYGDLDIDTKCTVVLVSALHDVAMESLVVSPPGAMTGDAVTLDVTAANYGDFTETFEVQATYDDQVIGTAMVSDLEAGQSQMLAFLWDTTGIPAGTYTIKVCAETVPGEIIIGNNCVEQAVSLGDSVSTFIDIKPGSCPNPLNTKSNGVTTVAILGTESLDVTRIDPTSVALGMEGSDQSVSPIRWNLEDTATPFAGDVCDCHDLDGDGYTDLVFKFRTVDLVKELKLYDLQDQIVPLTLTGNLSDAYDNASLNGTDCVRIKK